MLNFSLCGCSLWMNRQKLGTGRSDPGMYIIYNIYTHILVFSRIQLILVLEDSVYRLGPGLFGREL